MSQQILDLINSDATAKAAFDDDDDQLVIDTLNAQSLDKTDNTRRDSDWLSTEPAFASILDPATGATEADVIIETLRAGSGRVRIQYDKLAGNGIDLSNSIVQSSISVIAIAGGWPMGLAGKLAAFGVWTTSPAKDAIGRLLTLADVSAARATQARATDVADRTAYLAVLQAVLDQQAGTIADPTAVVPTRADILAALGAG